RRGAEALTRLGELHAASRPVKQRDSQVFLEQADLAAQRGLSDSQRGGRPGDRALFGDAQKVLEPVGVHRLHIYQPYKIGMSDSPNWYYLMGPMRPYRRHCEDGVEK